MRTKALLVICLLLLSSACSSNSPNSTHMDIEDAGQTDGMDVGDEWSDVADSGFDGFVDSTSEVTDVVELADEVDVEMTEVVDIEVAEEVDIEMTEIVDVEVADEVDVEDADVLDVEVADEVEVIEPPFPDVVLNEVNCHGQDFVEIENRSPDATADLAGYILEDGDGPTHEYILPPGTVVPPLGRIIIIQKTVLVPGFPFGIQCGKDSLRLRDPSQAVVDEVAPPLVMAGNTWSRLPDGDGPWAESSMTPFDVNQPMFDLEGFLFNPLQMITILLDFPQPSMEALWADPRTYVAGSFIVAADDLVQGPMPVGIRIKGKLGSFRTLDGKSAFKVKFNFADGDLRFHGLKKLTLNNMVQDRSMIHEALAYRIFAAFGVPCPRVGYAQLYVNGELWGLYLVLEPYDKITLSRHFVSTQHLYEGEYGEDIIPDMVADFEVDDGDPTNINDLDTFAALVAEDVPDDEWLPALESVADVPELLAMWAVEQYIGHWDGYAPTINNYYLNSDENGFFTMLPNGTDQTFYDARNIHSGYSYLFARCMKVLGCRSEYDQTMGELMPVVDALELEQFASDLSEFLFPWVQSDPRKEYSNEVVASNVQATRDFLLMRRAAVDDALDCLLDPEADLDGDGFQCDGDCDEGDATVNAGAFDICNDGIDQDCNGLIDDDLGCPDCQELWRGPHRYLVCPNKRPYDDGRLHCQEAGSELVMIDGPEEDVWLRIQLQNHGLAQCWIGLSDADIEGVFVWLDGTLPEWTNWGAGEPNDWGGNEDCTQFFAAGRWNDLNCNNSLAVACEDLCSEPGQDEDNDGALRCNSDCDDGDPTAYPGAEEICGDGIDNDCDGVVDNGPGCS